MLIKYLLNDFTSSLKHVRGIHLLQAALLEFSLLLVLSVLLSRFFVPFPSTALCDSNTELDSLLGGREIVFR